MRYNIVLTIVVFVLFGVRLLQYSDAMNDLLKNQLASAYYYCIAFEVDIFIQCILYGYLVAKLRIDNIKIY